MTAALHVSLRSALRRVAGHPGRRIAAAALLLLAPWLAAPPAVAGGRVDATLAAEAVPAPSTDRLIVKLREPLAREPGLRIAEVGGRHGERLQRLRGMSGGSHVVQLARRLSLGEARALARRLASDPSIAFVEPDARMQALGVPNDPLFSQQWSFYESAGGINLPTAWEATTGSAALTIGVLDTGIAPHADLAGRLVAGFDFIGDTSVSNDGNGRDADAADPGDHGCNGSGSSWHGTHVAGTIGAAGDNGAGVAGINWGSKLQSLRVLGRCGGYTSDIVDAMRWASGIAVPGLPANATPVRVLNLSLGGSGACGQSFQNAINDVVARGTVVVVAAGNANVDAANAEPANCNGVIAVGATLRSGGRAGYSNYGAKLALSAPGGGFGAGIVSTVNSGSTVPVADAYGIYQGTSMASPHVAGVVSLMLSVNPALTPAQVLAALQSSARGFPAGTGADCNRALCGAGIVDAAAAVAAVRPAAPPPPPPPPPPAPAGRINFALPAHGGVISASSTLGAGWPATGANDGNRRGSAWGSGGGWNDATLSTWPDWLQVDFGTVRQISQIDVFTVQDDYANPQEPTEAMLFNHYGVTDFEVQAWDGSTWQTVPGGSVSGNNRVWRQFGFAAVATSRVRVLVTGSRGAYSRITELEAHGVADGSTPPPPPAAAINVALRANGGTVAASSTHSSAYPAESVIDGERRGIAWSGGGGWNDATPGAWPDTLQIDFGAAKRISEIDVFTLPDDVWSALPATEATRFALHGVTDFDLFYWDGSAWAAVPGGSVSGNDRVWRKVAFAAVSASSIRVVVRAALGGYSRITEVEVYGTP